MTDGLAGIQAKLTRADEHLKLLDEAISAYLRGNPYRFVGEEHYEGEYHHWSIVLEVRELPPDLVWGPIIGDAVHNLRSALDHLAWQLALPTPRAETPNRIEFPVFLDSPAHDPGGTFTRKLKYLRREAHAVIEAAQPYKAGDLHHPLWLLHRLWNTDKHRNLHTAGFLFGTPSDDSPFGYGSWSSGSLDGITATENRTPLSSGYGNANQNLQGRMDTYAAMTFDVCLGQTERGWTKNLPYGGLPIRQILRRIRTYVDTEVVTPLAPLL